MYIANIHNHNNKVRGLPLLASSRSLLEEFLLTRGLRRMSLSEDGNQHIYTEHFLHSVCLKMKQEKNLTKSKKTKAESSSGPYLQTTWSDFQRVWVHFVPCEVVSIKTTPVLPVQKILSPLSEPWGLQVFTTEAALRRRWSPATCTLALLRAANAHIINHPLNDGLREAPPLPLPGCIMQQLQQQQRQQQSSSLHNLIT